MAPVLCSIYSQGNNMTESKTLTELGGSNVASLLRGYRAGCQFSLALGQWLQCRYRRWLSGCWPTNSITHRSCPCLARAKSGWQANQTADAMPAAAAAAAVDAACSVLYRIPRFNCLLRQGYLQLFSIDIAACLIGKSYWSNVLLYIQLKTTKIALQQRLQAAPSIYQGRTTLVSNCCYAKSRWVNIHGKDSLPCSINKDMFSGMWVICRIVHVAVLVAWADIGLTMPAIYLSLSNIDFTQSLLFLGFSHIRLVI